MGAFVQKNGQSLRDIQIHVCIILPSFAFLKKKCTIFTWHICLCMHNFTITPFSFRLPVQMETVLTSVVRQSWCLSSSVILSWTYYTSGPSTPLMTSPKKISMGAPCMLLRSEISRNTSIIYSCRFKVDFETYIDVYMHPYRYTHTHYMRCACRNFGK